MNLGVQVVIATLPIALVFLKNACVIGAFGTLVWYARESTAKMRAFLLTLAVIGGASMAFNALDPINVVKAAYPKINTEALR